MGAIFPLRQRTIFSCFLVLCFLVIYESMVIVWPTVRTSIAVYSYKETHLNYDYNEDLPDVVTIRKNRPSYGTTFKRKVERLLKSVSSSSSSSSSFSSSSSSSNSSSSEAQVKVILFWTSWFRKPWWVRFGNGGLDLVGANCPETRCYFTHEKSRLRDASAILFQSQRFYIDPLPSYRSPDQRWIWVHVEPPTTSLDALAELSPYRRMDRPMPSRLFNWTMTYHPDSDIMEPYGALIPLNHHSSRRGSLHSKPSSFQTKLDLMSSSNFRDSSSSSSFSDCHDRDSKLDGHYFSLRPSLLDTSSDVFRKYQTLLKRSPTLNELMFSTWKPNLHWGKAKINSWTYLATKRTRIVAWVSSHCRTSSEREKYVKELQKYVTVDVYGTCGTFRCGSRESHRDDRCWKHILSRKYLFLLSFENAVCDSYITEKLWRPLVYGMVPVVLGGSNYSQYLPPNSYINALDYSPSYLGLLLKTLHASPDYYIRYHLWRIFWKVTMRPPLCELCYKIHNDRSSCVQQDIRNWWESIGECRNPAQWRPPE